MSKTLKPWEQMTDAEKAAAHLAEARYYARKAAKATSRAKRESYRHTVNEAVGYALKWGATGAECRRGIAPYRCYLCAA